MKKAIFLLFAFAVSTASAQQATNGTSSEYPSVVNFSAEQDHQHMMNQLGIRELRPGPASRPIMAPALPKASLVW